MKKPFQDSPAWWQAAIIVGIIIGLAVLFSCCAGCGALKVERRTLNVERSTPNADFIPRNIKRLRPESVNGGGGVHSINSLVGHIVSYDAHCSNHFAICCIEWHPCETNQFELWETVTDTNGVPIDVGRWYCGTNVLRWNAEADAIYVPEYLDADGSNWISNAYFSTNFPGVLECASLHYIDEGPPYRIFRIRIDEPLRGPCDDCAPAENAEILNR